MRLSRYFLPILKETPKEAEIVSHRLMLRAGMIRQQAAGLYSAFEMRDAPAGMTTWPPSSLNVWLGALQGWARVRAGGRWQGWATLRRS